MSTEGGSQLGPESMLSGMARGQGESQDWTSMTRIQF